MRLEDIYDYFGGKFTGDVGVAMHSTIYESGISTTLKKPTITKTPRGIRLETKEDAVEIDIQNVTEQRSVAAHDCSFKYKDSGLVMSICFMMPR